jgi:hypothetical protein
MATEKQIVAELVNKRTENSKTYLLSDGSYRVIVHGGPVHYPDTSGNLHNINTKAYDEGDADTLDIIPSRESAPGLAIARERAKQGKAKSLFNRDNYDFLGLQLPYDARLPRNIKKGYTIGKGKDKLTFIPQKVSPAKGYTDPEHDNLIAYQDVWNDTDLHLELTPTGIKETIILKSDRAPDIFTFEVKGMDSLSELHLEPAWLVDAEGTRRDVPMTTRASSGKTYLDLTPDLTGLVYPVEIDPSVTVTWDICRCLTKQPLRVPPPYSTSSTLVIGHHYINSDPDYNKIGRILMLPDFSFLPTGAVVTDADLELSFDNLYNGVYGGILLDSVIISRTTTTWTGAESAETLWNISTTSTNAVTITGITANTPQTVSVLNLVLDMFQYTEGFKIISADEANVRNVTLLNAPVLTVDYIAPPTAPTLTAPNGGETWNAEHTITWTAAVESDGLPLQYHIQVSSDNGVTWADIIALTTVGATSYAYDFSTVPDSSTCLVRIRAYNGTLYGDYDQSDGVFTIQHNQAPTAPTNLSPSGTPVDRAAIQRLSWQHNDADGDPQSKFDLRWRAVGAVTWNEVTQVTANQYYDIPAGTMAKGNIEWQVRTYDQADLVSPYSDQATFYAGDKPGTPTITSPVDLAVVGEATPTVQWSSSGQAAYQLEVVGLWDSGEVTSTNKARTIGDEMENGQTYTIRLRTKNADGIWSDWHTITIDVSYTPPPNPTIATSAEDGYILLTITNPAPTGTEPTVTSNRVWRRKQGETEWQRIALGINGEYRDYAVASGVTYQYRVQAIGDNGTTSYSAVGTRTITLQGVWLHDVTDPAGTLHNFRYDGRGRSEYWDGRPALNQYVGRTYPVAVWDESEQHQLNLYLQLWKRTDDYTALLDLVRRKATICYRDGKGRKAFVVLPTLSAEDVLGFGANATIPATRIDYSEEV